MASILKICRLHLFLTSCCIVLLALIPSDCSAEEAQGSCGLITDAIVDYALDRFLGEEKVRLIPDIDTSTVEFERGKLYGLNTIRRACPIQVIQPSKTNSTSMTISLCVKAGLLKLTALLKVRTVLGFKVPEFLDVSIADVEMTASLQAKLRRGGSLKLNDFDITKLGKITLNNVGVAGSFDRVIGWLVNSKVKKVLIHFVEKGVKGAVEEELKKLEL